MRFVIVMVLIAIPAVCNAQFTAIPDPDFEQELVNDGIDSDGFESGDLAQWSDFEP